MLAIKEKHLHKLQCSAEMSSSLLSVSCICQIEMLSEYINFRERKAECCMDIKMLQARSSWISFVNTISKCMSIMHVGSFAHATMKAWM